MIRLEDIIIFNYFFDIRNANNVDILSTVLDEGNCNNFRGNIIDQSTTYAAYEYDEYENAYEKSAVLWLTNTGRID